MNSTQLQEEAVKSRVFRVQSLMTVAKAFLEFASSSGTGVLLRAILEAEEVAPAPPEKYANSYKGMMILAKAAAPALQSAIDAVSSIPDGYIETAPNLSEYLNELANDCLESKFLNKISKMAFSMPEFTAMAKQSMKKGCFIKGAPEEIQSKVLEVMKTDGVMESVNFYAGYMIGKTGKDLPDDMQTPNELAGYALGKAAQ